MFTPLKDHQVVYISLWDPAVDDAALDEATATKYVQTRDGSLLTFKQGTEPVKWHLSALDQYTLQFALSTAPADPDGGKLPDLLCYHLCQVGLKKVENLPEGAPDFNLRREGMLEKLSEDFVRAIPPEIARELGGVIYELSTVAKGTKKKSSSRSGGKRSKKGSPAKRARKG